MAARKSAKKIAAKKKPAAKAAKKSAPKKSAPAKKLAPKKSAAKKSAPKKPTGIPAGMHSVTPNLVFKDTAAAIDWYQKAFGATEVSRMHAPDGKGVWHAEIRIGDSMLYLNDESPMGSAVAPSGPRTSTCSIQLYVSDVDAVVKSAVDAGGALVMPVMDQFWGDRMGVVIDPFGHGWMISTRVREMTPDEMAAAGAEFARQFAAQHAAG